MFILTKPGADDIIRVGRTPEGTLYQLKINKVPDNLLTSPDFKDWAKYLDEFNTKYPDKKTTMFETFLHYYSDKCLSQMLIAAKKNPSTQETAAGLQTSLFNNWLRAKKTPADVSKLLNLKMSDPRMQEYVENFNVEA